MANFRGTPGNDDIAGSDNGDVILGLAGNDTLFGEAGDDLIIGGPGKDTISGGLGADTIDGLRGSGRSFPDYDQIDYSIGDEPIIYGANVNLAAGWVIDPYGFTDTLIDIEGAAGTSWLDILVGGDPDNDDYEAFFGYDGYDTIDGGSGIDEARYDRDVDYGGNEGITALLRIYFVDDGFGYSDHVQNVEIIRATQFRDFLAGDAGDNTFRGLGGSDVMIGGNGDDRADYSLDLMYGGQNGVSVNLFKGRGTDGFGRSDRYKSIEDVTGTKMNDFLFGSRDDNNMIGGGGEDTINGYNGDDELFGNNGDDSIVGGAGNDSLYGGNGADSLDGGDDDDMLLGGNDDDTLPGGDGDDWLDGGDGLDVLNGGAGNDTFAFDMPTLGTDTIQDFAAGEDQVAIESDGFGGVTVLVEGVNFIEGHRGASAEETPTFLYSQDRGNLWFDVDGTGDAAPVLFANLLNSPNLDASDFVII